MKKILFVCLNDAPVDTPDGQRGHASGCPATLPDGKTGFRRSLSQTLSPVPPPLFQVLKVYYEENIICLLGKYLP